MMNSNFQIAFNVAVWHSYFDKNICNCLQFSPGTATQTLLKRFEIKQRNTINGFDLYINSRTSLPAFLTYAGNTTGYTFFDFEIQTIAPSFNLFTDLPTSWLGQLVYDSGYSSNTLTGGVTQLTAKPLSAISANVLGTLTIHFGDIVNQGNNACAQFAINYTARATQWQYFVINKSAVQLENSAISDKTGLSFDGPENVTIDNGQQAMLFTSGNNLIPLSEVPKYKFDLVNNSATQTSQKPSPGKIIFKGLPNPDPVRIRIDTAGAGSRVVSPMYVYV